MVNNTQLKTPIQLDNSAGTLINPATEDKQDDIISAIGAIPPTSIVGLKNIIGAQINPSTEDGNLSTIAGKDFATQTTLALIKSKTDNLDTAISGIKTGTDKIISAPSTEAKQLPDNHQVTANAGTNLNTSSLALESGGNLASMNGKITACNTGAVVISSGSITLPSGASTFVGQQDTLDQYKITDIDADASPNYYSFTDKDGNYYFLKETVSAGADTYRYWKGTGDYVTDWTDRAAKVYDYFNSIF